MAAHNIHDKLAKIVQEEGERSDPELAKRHSRLANRAVHKGDFTGAADHLQVAFNLDPRPEYLRRKGDTLLHLRKPNESTEAHKAAVELELSTHGEQPSAVKVRALAHKRLRAESCKIISEARSDWIKKAREEEPEDSYAKAHAALEGLIYDIEDIVLFTRKRMDVELESHSNLGLFLSALTNRIIREHDTLILEVKDYTGFVGAFHERGTLRVKSLSGKHNHYWRYFAYSMRGGTVIIEDGPGKGYGDHMAGGELIVEGEVHTGGLSDMKDGHAVIRSLQRPEERSCCETRHEIGSRQAGGLIEIYGDIPYYIQHVSKGQIAGELIAHKTIGSEHVGCGKKGGVSSVGNIEGSKGWINVFVGCQMTDGTVVVKGAIRGPHEDYGLVGYLQNGGTIVVEGDVHGSIGSGTRLGSVIQIKGSVYGHVGWDRTAGAEIIVWGDVRGDVGNSTRDMKCTIKGNVYGNVESFGSENKEDRRRKGVIEISGDVHGNIGDLVYRGSEIIVHGNALGKVGGLLGGTVKVEGSIREIVPSLSGEVYQGGKNVTKIETVASVLRFFGFRVRGDD